MAAHRRMVCQEPRKTMGAKTKIFTAKFDNKARAISLNLSDPLVVVIVLGLAVRPPMLN